MSCRKLQEKENVIVDVILDTQVIVTHEKMEDGVQQYTLEFSDKEFSDFWNEKLEQNAMMAKAMLQTSAPAGRLVLEVSTNPLAISFRDGIPEDQLEELNAIAMGSILLKLQKNLVV